MKTISILGCGWLGMPLAQSLVKKGYSVKGSTTSFEKIPLLQKSGILPYQIKLYEREIFGGIDAFLSEAAVLIIDIPPKLRGLNAENFVEKIKNLVPSIINSRVPKVLFVSSTSVYADDNAVITAESQPQPESESGKQLLEAEQLLQCNPHFKTTVVRFGGLIGDDRHPVYFLAGKKDLENPEAPVNLIHQTDCLGIIERIIQRDIFGETFNAVAPFHPTRKDYYTRKATDLDLPLPGFDENAPSVGKIVQNNTEQILDYTFQNITL